jgi:hypothetical protein
MSTTAFALIADALALLTAQAAPGGLVRTNPTRPAERAEALVIDVRQGDTQQTATYGACTREWRTVYELEISGRGAAQGDPAQAIDAALAAVFAAALAADLRSLGVQGLDDEPQIAWVFEPADVPIAQATLRLAVRHHTAYADLTPSPISE